MQGAAHPNPASTNVAPSNSDLPLRLEHHGGVLQLVWDRNTRGLDGAPGGLLSVDDGGQKLELTLDRAELTNGSVAYIPTTPNVSFRLFIAGTNGPLTGSTQIGNAPKPPVAPPQEARATPHNTAVLEASGQASRTRAVEPPAVAPVLQLQQQRATRQFDPRSAEAALERKHPVDTPQLSAPPPIQFAQMPAVPLSSPPRFNIPAPTTAVQPRVSDVGSYVPPTIIRQQAPAMNAAIRNLVRAMYGPSLPVAVRVSIDANGNATQAEPISRAPRIIAEAAIDAARKWRFEPARLSGRAVPSQMVVRFVFRDE
jgi:hypothetical protein